jgi:predicted TIM-barrel fold metal-dependent hydrolase
MREAYGGLPSMLALGSLVLGGVLDRHPGLRVALLEAGAGWVPYVLDRIQESYESFGLRSNRFARDPHEIITGGQVFVSTEPDEPTLPIVADILGADHLVLGSDYCHPEGKCPFTMHDFAARDDLDVDLKREILFGNPARLYGLA